MIKISFMSFWSEQLDLRRECVLFTQGILGDADSLEIVLEDEYDPESSFQVVFEYNDYQIDSFPYYDEFSEFAENNDLYVVIDDSNGGRIGYWYDESDQWLKIENG